MVGSVLDAPPLSRRAARDAERRRMKRKKKKAKPKMEKPAANVVDETPDVEVEYVAAERDIPVDDPAYADFARVFEHFATPEQLVAPVEEQEGEEEKPVENQGDSGYFCDDESDEEMQRPLTNREKRKLRRMPVAELKQSTPFPDLVEQWDPASPDPVVLVALKAYRNTVEVPRHWSLRRKYLQGKRGVEKGPFKLPDFIADTGIEMIRETMAEREAQKKLKQKMKERARPKLGKIDIDYQVLHDAFFKFQTKPKMWPFGDIYYEGREFETDVRKCRPGKLSTQLRQALGMVEGYPPSYLLNMQRVGPPPSYPNLAVPGLNAPLPPGAQYGFHPGGWGKPPVDELGRPLFGDVFGTGLDLGNKEEPEPEPEPLWGELVKDDYVESEDEMEDVAEPAEEAEEEEGDAGVAGVMGEEPPVPEDVSGTETEAGYMSTGLVTPGSVDLRKDRRGDDTDDRPLYTVLEPHENKVGGALMGSAYTYKMDEQPPLPPGPPPEPQEHMNEESLRRKFDDTAGEEVKSDKKRKRKDEEGDKKYKQYKF